MSIEGLKKQIDDSKKTTKTFQVDIRELTSRKQELLEQKKLIQRLESELKLTNSTKEKAKNIVQDLKDDIKKLESEYGIPFKGIKTNDKNNINSSGSESNTSSSSNTAEFREDI